VGLGRFLPAPFGARLRLAAIPTLTYEPNASFGPLTLAIGNAGAGRRGVLVFPSRCTHGGFPFAASFAFADHSAGTASITLPCA
jgi:hypothetical protein